MSTSIRIPEATKQKLETIKRDDETFDELLVRLAVTRRPEDVEALVGFADEGVEEHMKDTRRVVRIVRGEQSALTILCLDDSVLAKFARPDPDAHVVSYLKRNAGEPWAISATVLLEFPGTLFVR